MKTPAEGQYRARRLPPRVLVVDDDPDVRHVHTRFLHGSGLEVFTADNGTMALEEVLRAAQDVSVPDVKMPVMDGLALCRQLRADAATRDVPVVVVTGDPAAQGRAAIDAGCDAVLEKPCSRTILLATIRQ